MDSEDNFWTSMILILTFLFLLLAFSAYMSSKERVEEPEVYVEFSPKEGISCVKTGYGVGCWKE